MKDKSGHERPLTTEERRKQAAGKQLAEILNATNAAHERAVSLRIAPLAILGAGGVKVNLAYIRDDCARAIQEINDLIVKIELGEIMEGDFKL